MKISTAIEKIIMIIFFIRRNTYRQRTSLHRSPSWEPFPRGYRLLPYANSTHSLHSSRWAHRSCTHRIQKEPTSRQPGGASTFTRIMGWRRVVEGWGYKGGKTRSPRYNSAQYWDMWEYICEMSEGSRNRSWRHREREVSWVTRYRREGKWT